MEGLATPFKGIAQGIVKLGEHFSSVLNYLNPTSKDFILKRLWEFLTNIVSYINPLDENFFGRKLVEFIGDLLEELFIPQQDHFGELNEKITSKFGFIGQVKELVYSLFPENSTYSLVGPPNWTITYMGTTVTLIDWSAFEEFRGEFHMIIIFIMWASFFIRLYKRLPSIIYGFSDK